MRLIESRRLGVYDGCHVTPLPLGRLSAPSIPLELPQDGVLRGVDEERNPVVAVRKRHRNSSRQALAVERVRPSDKDVDFHRRGYVNDVERPSRAHCFDDRVTGDVALGTHRMDEPIDIRLVHVDDHVDVIRGPRFPMHRAGERTADDIRDAKSSQGTDD